VRGDGVGELAGILDLVDRDQDLGRYLLVQLDVLLKLRNHGTGQRGDLLLRARLFADHFRVSLKEHLVFGETHDAGTLAALDQHLDGAVGSFSSCNTVPIVPII